MTDNIDISPEAVDKHAEFLLRYNLIDAMKCLESLSARVAELEIDRAALIIARDMMGNNWAIASERSAILEAKVKKLVCGMNEALDLCEERDTVDTLLSTLSKIQEKDTE